MIDRCRFIGQYEMWLHCLEILYYNRGLLCKNVKNRVTERETERVTGKMANRRSNEEVKQKQKNEKNYMQNEYICVTKVYCTIEI